MLRLCSMKLSPAIFLRRSILAFSFLISSSTCTDTIHPLKNFSDGDELVSADRRFVLGFFSPKGTTNRYLGIWYYVSVQTIVWIATRESPLHDDSGVLSIDSSGNLVLSGNSSEVFRATPQISSADSIAQLLDSGNFVLKENNSPPETFLWQSFDYPTDTFLPGMKIGQNLTANRRWNFTSWKNESDPSPGEYSFIMDPRGPAQPFLMKNTTPIYRYGPWNGIRFSGNLAMKSLKGYVFFVVQSAEATYYEYKIISPSLLARLVVEPDGHLRRYHWANDSARWVPVWAEPDDSSCDNYTYCGANGVCNPSLALKCNCFGGFEVKQPEEWSNQIWSDGCVRKTNLSCGGGDGFLRVDGVKLPDTVNSTVHMDMDLHQCKEACAKNCSCAAYARANISDGGSGCITWVGDLIDTRTFEESGQQIFIRLPKVDLEEILHERSKAKRKAVISGTVAAAGVCLLFILCGYMVRRRRNQKLKATGYTGPMVQLPKSGILEETSDLPLFDLETMMLATENFAERCKIGKGGFGEVYKGELRDGTAVAVKRQTPQTGVGIEVFATEVRLIAKLQHRNLVRLLVCCIDGEERLLVYEFMPNGSLDSFIFGDKEKRQLLNSEKRLEIILGVARGLVYLHQDSRLRVIHRDLKAANVLLDEALSPKISDFGTARVFQREQMQENTVKIVGTLGYMSPEYLMGGCFSEKSDVFGFGVLVLEIISGRKNHWISRNNQRFQLLAKAWTMWADGNGEKLLDRTLAPPGQLSDILRFMHVGLLCVQELPDDRPTMQHAAYMLVNKYSILPPPQKPGFFVLDGMTIALPGISDWSDSSRSLSGVNSTNLEGR